MGVSPHRRSLAHFSEFSLIDVITRHAKRKTSDVVVGIGDDAALLQPISGFQQVVSTDLFVERIHFNLQLHSLKDVGYRAAVANLSDMAAMGAFPRFLLVMVAVPSRHTVADIMALYRGIQASCKAYDTVLIGGDTSASKDDLFLGMTIIGYVEKGRALQRAGAQPGDAIYVTGTLGDSAAGLQLLSSSLPSSVMSKQAMKFLISRHLRPTPRISMGRLLSTYRWGSAAIDLSDGLSGDLAHLCQASGVGAEIESAALPLSPSFRRFTCQHQKDPCRMALQGGEDFELLFTVSSRNKRKVEIAARAEGCPITRIGTIRPKKAGISLRGSDGSSRKMPQISYDHFRQ